MQALTVVMYHYVRDTEKTPYPGIKALSVADFKGQLEYLENNFEFIGLEDIFAALDGNGASLPDNGVLLTFDDGHSDHHDTVYPLLKERGISGIFFPPAMPVIERRVLDVNKIQFIIAQVEDTQTLVDATNTAVQENRDRFSLDTPDADWSRHAQAFRYDGADVIFVKRMLQHVLPAEMRSELVSNLFERYVTEDEQAFADALYLNAEQLRDMVANGMIVGSHGYSHRWMDRMGENEQRSEIAASLDFLNGLGVSELDWVMCYPFGGYNDGLVQVVEDMGCKLGFTTESATAHLGEHHPLCLPRLDTNEVPKSLKDGHRPPQPH